MAGLLDQTIIQRATSAIGTIDWVGLWHQYRTLVCAVAVVLLFVYTQAAKRQDLLAKEQKRKRVLVTTVSQIEDDVKTPASPLPQTAAVRPLMSDSGSTPPASAKPIKRGPKKVIAGKRPAEQSKVSTIDNVNLHLFYFSLTTTTEKLVAEIAKDLPIWWASNATGLIQRPVELAVSVHDIADIEFDDFFLSTPAVPKDGRTRNFYSLVIPSYNIDSVLDAFIEMLKETHNDFRIDTGPLSTILGFSVFGIGDKEGWPTEQDGFCFQAKEIDKWMARLSGRRRAYPLGMGDTKSDLGPRLSEWLAGMQSGLTDIVRDGGLGEGVSGSGDAVESDEEDDDAGDSDGQSRKTADQKTDSPQSGQADDVEELGNILKASSGNSQSITAVDYTEYKTTKSKPNEAKEMVPKESPTYKALTKQGYTIVGSHSGVKICRWTKSALRGRGSCYKYSFYGIRSHLCMETTPSLSCSNKCVFCWRHGTNPVGTTWRWQVDPPEMIFEGVKAGHYKKIKMLKGVPGVRAERFEEAMRIRHCALSLVGEPIFYPHINEFTAMLHKERISSFLVCNAQHPDQLAALGPVTQLYVSIDASNKESLRKVDRPLHRDFWERFTRCLDILRERRFEQRTVFRLTLVKGFNTDEVEGYADLVARGLPCFVEVKGVTYCGTSTSAAAGLTMQNVPFYEEVCAFVTALEAALNRRGLEYGIGAEHAHSCCILLASSRFRIKDRWHTLIDYEKFFACLEAGKPFGPEDYIGEATPEWAQWGNGGFNPDDERVFTKGKKKAAAALAKAEAVALGSDACE